MKKNKMNYSTKDKLTAKDLDPTMAKIRIGAMIDLSVYEALKADATKKNKKYQTILNDILLKHYSLFENDSKTKKNWKDQKNFGRFLP